MTTPEQAPGRAPVPGEEPGTAPDAGLERWRLVLGSAAERHTGPLGPGNAGRDAALDWLYGRDPDLARRGCAVPAPPPGRAATARPR